MSSANDTRFLGVFRVGLGVVGVEGEVVVATAAIILWYSLSLLADGEEDEEEEGEVGDDIVVAMDENLGSDIEVFNELYWCSESNPGGDADIRYEAKSTGIALTDMAWFTMSTIVRR